MPTMATPTDPDDPAPARNGSKSFFEILPQEIRDSIYEHTFDHEVTRHSYHMRFQAHLPHLRLVSRQFKREYEKRSPSNTEPVVTDQTLPFQELYPDTGLVLSFLPPPFTSRRAHGLFPLAPSSFSCPQSDLH
jgi:hypothetical protein